MITTRNMLVPVLSDAEQPLVLGAELDPGHVGAVRVVVTLVVDSEEVIF